MIRLSRVEASGPVAGRSAEVAALPQGERTRRLSILAPTRYPWRFNGPRYSRHDVQRRAFAPLNLIHPAIEGVTAFNPWPPRRFDLVHGFNRIPLGLSPFVIGFESHLPRAFGLEGSSYHSRLSALLASPRCRGIVAISDHAADIIRRQHAGSAHGDVILRKLSRRYPNLDVGPPGNGPTAGRAAPLEVVFVGNDFARKGGCVTVRVAEMALAARLPVTFHVVSALQVGAGIWTDPSEASFFDPYLQLLDLPNVRWQSSLSNAAVRALLGRAHLHLLPTFGDTFGYSAIEAMAQGTPVLATAQGALPEIIDHDRNGYLVPIETNAVREWVHLGASDRSSRRFERVFAEAVEDLAAATFRLIHQIVDTPEGLPAMRRAARHDAIRLFDAQEASRGWDDYYEDAVRHAN